MKPLYYHFDGQTLRFRFRDESYLDGPAVQRQIDFQALHYFLNLRFIPGDRTLLAGIRRLPPAHYLLFEQGRVHLERYFELPTLRHNVTSSTT